MDPEYPTLGELERDIAAMRQKITRLEASNKKLAGEIGGLIGENLRLKSKGGWSEVELVHNLETGMVAAVRTEYRVEAYHMRLDFSPSMMQGMGY